MSEVSIIAINIVDNPAPFTAPIVLDVQYECLVDLRDDLQWQVSYIGSAESDAYDQVLDEALVGPVQQGTYRFRMEAPAPDPSRIPPQDLLGVTALLLTCSYAGKEFVRVGYYVNVEYTDPELADPERRPNPPDLAKLQRSIMADHPRVTKFPHDFDAAPAAMPEGEEGEPEPEPEEELLEELAMEDDGEEDEDELGDEGEIDLEGTPLAAPQQENVNPNGGFGFGVLAAGSSAPEKPSAAAAAAAAGGGGQQAAAGDEMEL